MSIKRFVATKDTTITDAYQENLRTRGTNANMGEADSLEAFSLYATVGTSSVERSRILVQFPIDEINTARSAGIIPLSGTVNYFLRLYNVKHPYSVPRRYSMTINPLSQPWEEGYGLDMEGYTDLGYVSGTGGTGATWNYASSGAPWLNPGGTYYTGSGKDLDYYFTTGLEDIELDITNTVKDWISGTIPNYGLLIRMSSAVEDGSTLTSYYTKKFSARGSEYYMRRPSIEARWDQTEEGDHPHDDREDFYAESINLSPLDNTMNLTFYNRVEGTLKNIYGNPEVTLRLYLDPDHATNIAPSYVTVTNASPGIYRAEVILNTTATIVYDEWVNATSEITEYFTASFHVHQREFSFTDHQPEYIFNIGNLKQSYAQNERARLNINVRERDWSPTIYSIASVDIENTILPDLYYKIFRLNDNYIVINYSTGALAYTKVSYDSYGNYFLLDMDIFEKDYGYGIKLATWDGYQLKEFKDTFKFRVK